MRRCPSARVVGPVRAEQRAEPRLLPMGNDVAGPWGLRVTELLSGSPTVERLAAPVRSRQLTEAGSDEVDDVVGRLSGLSDDEVTALLAMEPDGEARP
ncbi:hypothetical protein [Streptomyces monashensis]|uniref:Uncharacterized protein n=1 Tax=Streptomyces monashensis TaxID=1678012 RepID=A0A1S2PV40_9ACTN|nr:hypothetical protein [Streptomyces monashensis]OIJ97689.1 hypothetical protein BIV23_31155 [Streptomyces monashensis]